MEWCSAHGFTLGEARRSSPCFSLGSYTSGWLGVLKVVIICETGVLGNHEPLCRLHVGPSGRTVLCFWAVLLSHTLPLPARCRVPQTCNDQATSTRGHHRHPPRPLTEGLAERRMWQGGAVGDRVASRSSQACRVS